MTGVADGARGCGRVSGWCARGEGAPGLRPSSPPPPLAGHRVTFPFLSSPLLPASFRCKVITGSGPGSGRIPRPSAFPSRSPSRGRLVHGFPSPSSPSSPTPPTRPAPAFPATPSARAHPDTTAPRQSSPGRRSPPPPGSWRHSPLPRPRARPSPCAVDSRWGVPPVVACEAPSSASPSNASAALVHARGRRPLRVPGRRSSPPLPSFAGWVALRACFPSLGMGAGAGVGGSASPAAASRPLTGGAGPGLAGCRHRASGAGSPGWNMPAGRGADAAGARTLCRA